jgi:hypothetical protein
VTLFTSILSSQLYHRLSSSLSLISRSVSVIYIITANAKTHIKPTPQQPKPRPLSITSGQPNPTQPTTASLPRSPVPTPTGWSSSFPRAILEASPAPQLRSGGSPHPAPIRWPTATSRGVSSRCAPDLLARSRSLARLRSDSLCPRLLRLTSFCLPRGCGSVQETQRLLSEPGARALCLAVSVDFSKFCFFF